MKAIIHSLIAVLLLLSCATASRIWQPSTSLPFETPVLNNGYVGGSPSTFNLTAAVFYPTTPCQPFEADGKIVILKLAGACPIGKRIENTVKSGAVAIMIDMDENGKLGRFANTPLTPMKIQIPIVAYGASGRTALESLGVFNPQSPQPPRPNPPRNPKEDPDNNPDHDDPNHRQRSTMQQLPPPPITVQLVPGRNEWADKIIDQPWWLAMQMIFCGGFFSLLILIEFKFVKKIRREDHRRNISLVYLVFQAFLCIFVLVRWLDPLLTRGLFTKESELMFTLLPSSLSLIGSSLMAFFWFKLILPFDGAKITLFFNHKRLKIGYWLFAGAVVVLTIVEIIAERFQPTMRLLIGVEIVQLIANLFVAVMFFILTIRWALIKKRQKTNLDNKDHFLMVFSRRVLASLIISSVIMTIEPITHFVLMRFVFMNEFFHVAVIMTESFLLAMLVLFQVLFMPVEPFMNKIEDQINAQDMNSMSAGTNSEENSHRLSLEHV